MSVPVIEVERLSKKYRLGVIGASSVRDRLEYWWSRRKGGVEGGAGQEFWALRDISFTVDRGEIVGIVGGNGAGKSTALKLLSRITEPTTGRAILRGRVASLLEVGTGFHPDLSGRDNIYMNGTILGMKISEIRSRFDDIVAFAEIGDFIDTPVKRYSSGMYVRLAFAVAAHLDPEIMLIDEVLAVGDAAFQKRCIGKMNTLARDGRTIVFVSHNMTAVQALCARAIWLDHGRICEIGSTRKIVSNYLQRTAAAESTRNAKELRAIENPYVILESVSARGELAHESQVLTVATPFKIVALYVQKKSDVPLTISLQVYDQNGLCIFASPSSAVQGEDYSNSAGLYQSECHIPGHLLNEGSYRITLLFVRDRTEVVAQFENVLDITIQDDLEGRDGWYGKWGGVVRPRLRWSTFPVTQERTESVR